MPKKKEVVEEPVVKEPVNVQEKITALLKGTNREFIDMVIQMMVNEGFFTAPCSGGNHLCQPGGLAIHSLNVCETALKLGSQLLGEDFESMKDSIIIASLLHDLGKIGDYNKQMYVPNILKSGKQSEAKPFARNKDLSNVPHAVRSVKLASLMIDLTEDEEWAILTHDGLYDFMKYEIAGHETKLSLIIHWADLWSCKILEGNTGDDE